MESVILTIGNNNMKLRTRLRNTANGIYAKTTKLVAGKKRRRNANNLIHKRSGKKKNGEIIIKCDLVHNGNLTSEVYEAWCSRIGPTTDLQAPRELLQPLFNDLQLYPTDVQVKEMVSFIRQCSRLSSSSNFLTFGEVCLLTSELRKIHRTSSLDTLGDVFLGGSCGNTTWRTEIAIPILKKASVSYYNPQVKSWKPELIIAEQKAKQNAKILLFVVDGETRCAAGMLEMAQLAAQKSDRLIAVLPEFSENRRVAGEYLDDQESFELCDARNELVKILENRGIRAHTNIEAALDECLRLLTKEPTIILEKLRREYEKYCLDGGLTLTDACAVCYRLTGRLLTVNELRTVLKANNRGSPRDVLLDYDQLCTLVAEITTQSSSHNNENGHSGQRNYSNENGTFFEKISFWKLYIFRTQQLLRIHINNIIGYDEPQKEQKKYDLFLTDNIDLNHVESKTINFSFTTKTSEVDYCKKFLFFISESRRNAAEMILAAHFIALSGQNTILCIKDIGSEKTPEMSLQAITDYNRARSYLKDLALRENSIVFDNIDSAIKLAVNQFRQQN